MISSNHFQIILDVLEALNGLFPIWTILIFLVIFHGFLPSIINFLSSIIWLVQPAADVLINEVWEHTGIAIIFAYFNWLFFTFVLGTGTKQEHKNII
jgi:hypothetical protein